MCRGGERMIEPSRLDDSARASTHFVRVASRLRPKSEQRFLRERSERDWTRQTSAKTPARSKMCPLTSSSGENELDVCSEVVSVSLFWKRGVVSDQKSERELA